MFNISKKKLFDNKHFASIQLQMLNVCMERRSIREGGLPFSMMSPKGKSSHTEDSDDEFFDCANEEEEGSCLIFGNSI